MKHKIKIIKQDSDFQSEGTKISAEVTEVNVSGGANKLKSILESKYKRPKNGTVQDKMTTDDIRKKLKGYVPLKTKKELKILKTLKPYKSFIKYFNKELNKFRTGGLLVSVDPDLKYIMLANTSQQLIWSVQLDKNVIFIKDPKLQDGTQIKEKETEKEDAKQLKIQKTKDKLYDLYIKGKLCKEN